MTTTTLPTGSPRRASDSPWAVETHGLTKRLGDNVANNVELLIPRLATAHQTPGGLPVLGGGGGG